MDITKTMSLTPFIDPFWPRRNAWHDDLVLLADPFRMEEFKRPKNNLTSSFSPLLSVDLVETPTDFHVHCDLPGKPFNTLHFMQNILKNIWIYRSRSQRTWYRYLRRHSQHKSSEKTGAWYEIRHRSSYGAKLWHNPKTLYTSTNCWCEQCTGIIRKWSAQNYVPESIRQQGISKIRSEISYLV